MGIAAAAAADWFRKAIAAQEVLSKLAPTAWRRRVIEVWQEQNRKFPNHPYIENRLEADLTRCAKPPGRAVPACSR